MAELNGSEFANITNHTFDAFCTGSLPLKTVRITLYSILMTFSLIGHLLVVAVFYRNKTLRTAVHYFVINMAISDLIIPVIILPWKISKVYYDDLWLVDGVLGIVLCKLVQNSRAVPTSVSMLSMMAIAADRFRAVLFPMKSALFSRNKRRLIIAATWIASVGYQAHFIYGAELVSGETGLFCVIQWELASYTGKVFRINWISYICVTFICAIVLAVLYSSIIISLYRQKNNLHLATEIIKNRSRRNRKIANMLVIIVVVFYVVWIPYHVVHFIRYFIPSIRLPCFLIWLCDKLLLLYVVVNPVVYYVFNEEYRQGFRELLCCPWLCHKCNDCFQPSVPPQS